MSSTIFTVNSHYAHEGNDIIAAFSTKKSAEEFKSKIDEYHATEPKSPRLGESAEWAKYFEDVEDWTNDHPAGQFSQADIFFVKEVPFNPTQENDK